MSEEQLRELQEYNLEYLEAQQSEEMFGGDYISAVELKYAKKEIDKLVDTNEDINREFSQYKYESKKEIERLNNIINEFEEELKWQRKVCLSLNEGFTISRIDTLINKLQELKGDGSNE